ncbi:hypothetical protein MHM84_03585 [Halomonas sp. McH1-25]|uniref:hypothetical protein n=1 Tax=unclassified Halomonas TaxID=2609666 RepID=UPI001EF4055E|nr:MULTISPECIES: hypothetical protein [unclassified Halomonas]MCG7598854.1 hypothetical protein [Halomonas sp. McH1-25]MCP1340817.1 hypothetical protein [Halomonas sp. FL8]MCP1361300.1 hypothetical protein [Halomonas sp. BBD45]MCP1364331.1 hypothetical protein [Halomonas sp. BBD48]
MGIHEEMAFWSNKLAGEPFESQVGVEAAEIGSEGVAEVLEVLGDREAHTIETIDSYLQGVGIDLSGCQIAACLVRLHFDGHSISTLGPYDGFGCPERFKLTGQVLPREEAQA